MIVWHKETRDSDNRIVAICEFKEDHLQLNGMAVLRWTGLKYVLSGIYRYGSNKRSELFSIDISDKNCLTNPAYSVIAIGVQYIISEVEDELNWEGYK